MAQGQFFCLCHSNGEVEKGCSLVYITLLNDVAPPNIKVRCGELSYNLRLHTQLFKHPIVIFQEHVERALSVGYCHGYVHTSAFSFLKHSNVATTYLLENHIFFLLGVGKLFICRFKFTYKWCKFTCMSS